MERLSRVQKDDTDVSMILGMQEVFHPRAQILYERYVSPQMILTIIGLNVVVEGGSTLASYTLGPKPKSHPRDWLS
jgi:hypothetical protein